MLGLLGEQAQDDRVQGRTNRGRGQVNRCAWNLLDVGLPDVHGRGAIEGQPPRQGLVEQHAEGIEV